MDSADRSVVFRAILLRVSEILVAAKHTASAALVSRLVVEWFVGPFLRSRFRRRGFASLNAPISERLIVPWVEFLSGRGVQFRFITRIVSLQEEAREITSVTTAAGEVLTADYYCIALPQLAFIAGEFTRTNFVIPTVEKSCESGMRCASAICEAAGRDYDEARLEPATLPLGFLRTHWFHVLSKIV